MYHRYNTTDPLGMYYDQLPDHPTLFILLIAFALCSLFASCASVQKTEHEQQTHVVTTDSAGTETSHAGQVTQQAVNVDSIVTAILQRTREELARQEQEHEITTETLTETIDSLGHIVRQSQRVTDRTLSRLEQQRIERLEQTFEQQIHQAILSHDSLWNDRFSQYQASMSDSLATLRDRQMQRTASNPVTWWQNLQIILGRLALLAIAVLLALWLLRKKLPWLPFGK
jgi:uncharacterized protein (DUF2344 family)